MSACVPITTNPPSTNGCTSSDYEAMCSEIGLESDDYSTAHSGFLPCADCGYLSGEDYVTCDGVPTFCFATQVRGGDSCYFDTPSGASAIYIVVDSNSYSECTATANISTVPNSYTLEGPKNPNDETYWEEAYFDITYPGVVRTKFTNNILDPVDAYVYYTEAQPTHLPTVPPTRSPTTTSTTAPTTTSTETPTKTPTKLPSVTPTNLPTRSPTLVKNPTYTTAKMYGDDSCTEFTQISSVVENVCLLSGTTYYTLSCGKYSNPIFEKI
jgi:hypothetical protein